LTTPANSVISIKAHDRLPSVEAILGFASGAVEDLSTASAVHFIMRDRQSPTGPPKVDSPAIIVDALAGSVRYDWGVGDTDTPGTYNAEWQVTYTDGRKQTFPTLTYHTVNVLADLDGA
jgi:hypothetical protein